MPRTLADLAGTNLPTFRLGKPPTRATFDASGLTAPRALTVQNASGTLALTADVAAAQAAAIAFAIQRANHSGTQAAATISDFAAAALAATSAAYQPLNGELTAIAALTTTAYGRGALALADAPAFAAYSGLALLATSGIVGALTLTKTGTTARTATFPDAGITVAGINLAQTWSATQTITSPSDIVFNGAAVTRRRLKIQTGGVDRWWVYGGDDAESGANAGTAFYFRAFDDAGSAIDFPLSIVRAAGGAITLARPVTITGAITHSGTNTSSGSTALRLAYFGGTSGDGAAIELRGSTYSGSPDTGFLRVGSTYVANWSTAGFTLSSGTVTVPNGTAAAPGLRLTSEASGLYRVSATSLGFAVAGAAAASLTSAGAFAATSLTASGGVTGTTLALDTGLTAVVTNSNACWLYRTNGSGSGDFASFGHLIIQPRTSAANPRDVVLYTGDTTPVARLRVAGDGVVSCTLTTDATTTSDGAVRLSGGLSQADGKQIVQGATSFHYWGPSGTDGSWRFGRSGNDFVIQRRESAVWVTKQTIVA